MAALERTYTIPLRREWLKTVKYKRAKKAVRAIREFLMRHMKAAEENIRLGKHLNLELWKHSIKNPPARVKVNVTKDDKGVVVAELFGAPKAEAPKKKAKLTDARSAVKEAQQTKEAPAEKKAARKPAAPKAPAPAAPAPQAPAPKQGIGQIIR
jgi:ribosomal protein L31E